MQKKFFKKDLTHSNKNPVSRFLPTKNPTRKNKMGLKTFKTNFSANNTLTLFPQSLEYFKNKFVILPRSSELFLVVLLSS